PPLRDRRLELNLPLQRTFVHADRIRLMQVFSKLIDNAVKFTISGGSIRVTLAPTHDGCAAVTVADDGIGIPHETLDSVFDLFVQARTPVAHASGGLGIGLTIVRRLTELHGGTVVARSRGVGYGTELEVRLPALAPSPTVGGPTSAGDLAAS